MTVDIRSSNVFLKTDLRNMLAALERANPQYKQAFDTLRVSLGIEVVENGGASYARLRQITGSGWR